MSDSNAKHEYVPSADGADPLATRLVAELQHDRGILICKHDPTEKFLYTGARDYLLHRWDLSQEPVLEPPVDPKKKPKYPPVPVAPAGARVEMSGHESWVSGIGLFDDGDRIATGDFVGRLIVRSDRTGESKTLSSFEAHKGSIRKVSVSPNCQLVATAGNDGAVRVWRADRSRTRESSTGTTSEASRLPLHLELLGHDCHVYHVAFHPDGKSLVSADLKGRLKHWDVDTGKLVRELDAGLLYTYSVKYQVDVGGIRGMTFNADGSQLACAGATGEKGIAHSGNARVLLLDWESGTLLKELKPEKEEICTAWGVQFHPDGFIVASGGSRTGGFLWFWTPDEEVAFHMLKFRQRAPGFDLDLAPDKNSLAVANHDGAVRVYDLTKYDNESTTDKKA